MKTIKCDIRKHDQGQGLVEFALVLPLILLMIMGMIDFARMFYIYSAISSASACRAYRRNQPE